MSFGKLWLSIFIYPPIHRHQCVVIYRSSIIMLDGADCGWSQQLENGVVFSILQQIHRVPSHWIIHSNHKVQHVFLYLTKQHCFQHTVILYCTGGALLNERNRLFWIGKFLKSKHFLKTFFTNTHRSLWKHTLLFTGTVELCPLCYMINNCLLV